MMHTIHRIDPVGCFWLSVPLHPVFTVAKPKSPILTVESSCKKISTHTQVKATTHTTGNTTLATS